MNDTDAESDLRADRRSPHCWRRSVQHNYLLLPERRPNPLARFRDPFNDHLPDIGQRRLRERRVYVQERLPSIPSFVAPLDNTLLVPLPDRDSELERDLLLAELIAARPLSRTLLQARGRVGGTQANRPIVGFPLATHRRLPGQSRRPVPVLARNRDAADLPGAWMLRTPPDDPDERVHQSPAST